MLKKLLTFAAIAALSLTASAGTVDMMGTMGSSHYNAEYNSETKTASFTAGWGCCGWWLSSDGVDYSDYKSIVIKFASPAPANGQLSIEYVGASSETEPFSQGDTELEYEFNADAKTAVKQMYLQLSAVGDLVLSEAYLVENEAEGAYETVQLNLSGEQGKEYNLLLSEYEKYDDDVELDVFLTISNASSNVAAGWGVGEIVQISNYDAVVYNFTAKAVSQEGAENKYKFTVGQFKDFAKLESGDYWVDSWNQSGVTFNVYNGATLDHVSVQVPVAGTDPEQPEEKEESIQVLFDGNETPEVFDWYPGFTIPKSKIIKAGVGAALLVEAEAGEGETSWSLKLSTNYTGTILPSFKEVENYSEEWNTVYKTNDSFSYEFTDADIDLLTNEVTDDSYLHVSIDKKNTLKKVTLFLPGEDKIVLFEGADSFSWYPGFTFEKQLILNYGAGSTLEVKADKASTETSWSLKLSTAGTSNVLPSFSQAPTYDSTHGTAYSTSDTFVQVITDEDIQSIERETTDDTLFHVTLQDITTLRKGFSAVSDIIADSDENAPVEYFNLQGVRVSNPENGLYIRRQGSKASKILIK
jgi:hypothetical protein